MATPRPAYSVGSPLQNVFPSPVVATRAPAAGDTRYEIGQVWINKSTNQAYILTSVTSGTPTWAVASPGASDVDTITGDSGGALSPTLGNITIAGGTGITTTGAGSTITIDAALGQQPITPYVVDGAGGGDYTTIQSALDAIGAAGTGQVWVRPGTYTENLVFPNNINVTIATGADENAGAAYLVGEHTPPAAGNVVCWRMKLTSATHIFNSGAAGTANLVLSHNNYAVNGYIFNVPNWSAGSMVVFAAGDQLSTSSGIVNNTGGASVYLFQSSLGVGAGNALITSGTTFIQSCNINCPVTFGSGTTVNAYSSNFSKEITFSGTATGNIHDTYHTTGASPCITMSSSAAVSLFNSTLLSSNDPAIDGAGAGTLTFESVSFLSNSNMAATLTTARGATRGGTSFATTFDTDVAAAGLTISATDIDADGTDANISITATPKGSGTFTVDSGGILNSAGDIINTHSSAAADVTVEVTNSDNTSASSRAGFEAAVGGTSSGDPYVNFLISGGQSFTMGIDNSSTNDDFVISDAAALGTANRISIDGTSGNVSIPTSDLDVTRAGGAATPVQASVVNSDNTNADSPAQVTITSGGTSGGDAFVLAQISGGQAFSMGIDNSSTNDDFVISDNSAPGTNNRISIDGVSGDTSILNNLVLPTAATQLQVKGGAVTDFIGQATLTAGTVTVLNTNIAAGDRIVCTRSSINGSTALGILITAITPATSFTITAVQPGTPASAETNDVSIVDYFIVRSI
jgi:hypothetical protein